MELQMGRLGFSTASEEETWFGVLVDNQDRLVASSFNPSRHTLNTHLKSIARKMTETEPKPAAQKYAESMIELFKGRDVIEPFSLNPELATAYQEKVYEILRKIPRARVTSYGMIAAAINSGPRAVGTAVASNPWSLFVPCHRVVPSGLTVGNYGMSGSLDLEGSLMKRKLLRREGVPFRQDRILPGALWEPRGG